MRRRSGGAQGGYGREEGGRVLRVCVCVCVSGSVVRIIFFSCCGWGRVARLPGKEGGDGWNKEEELRGKYWTW